MPVLTALLNEELILLADLRWDGQEAALRAASHAGRLISPCCRKPLVLKWGLRVVRHFAHHPGAQCPYERWSEPESPEHAAGKLLLYQWCRQAFPHGRVALEHPIAQTCQRPDVLVELPDGERYAIEYQRSAISLRVWTERHEGYRSLGITDIWVMGENRLHDALPAGQQQRRWEGSEPGMLFLKPRAFENAAAPATPYDVPWWRGDRQAELWAEQELAARTGREVHPWYRRAAMARLRSLTFLDAGAGLLHIYRGMRELRGHVDSRMASACHLVPLAGPGLDLTPHGFVTPVDRERLAGFEARAGALEQQLRRTAAPRAAETPAPYTAEVPPMDPRLPAYFSEEAQRRARLLATLGLKHPAFRLEEQEAEQRRRLEQRAGEPTWRAMVDRLGLAPSNLLFLVGVPIPDDTVIQVHRTVWQAFVYYWLIAGRRTGSFRARWVRQHLERRFGLDPEMVRVSTLVAPGRLNDPEAVVGRYLNLLSAAGYLRSDQGNEHFRYYFAEAPSPPLALADRSVRREAWAGLLAGRLRLDGHALAGEGFSIPLIPGK